ncbi:Beta propeller domain protein [uncultured archaeon]|nr:Beta propeller domain protein [uncultured archaeon]
MAKWGKNKLRVNNDTGGYDDSSQREEDRKFNSTAISLVLVAIVVSALFIFFAPQAGTPSNNLQMSKFSSYDELVNYFSKAQSNYGRGIYATDLALPAMANIATGAMKNNSSQESTAGSAASDYSKTNVQVVGVDEADIIKNDGKYIYAIAKGQLFIVNAFPAEDMNIISTVDLNGATPIEMFISDDSTKLVVFANSYGYYGGYYATGVNSKMTATSMPTRYPYLRESGAIVQLYNISDKAAPVLEKEISFEGSYLTSRLIGDNAYFVINSYPRWNWIAYSSEGSSDSNGTDSNGIIPMMTVNGKETPVASAIEIGKMPYVMPSSFVTVASLNMKTMEIDKETVAASADNVYASQDNLYFASQYWDYYDYNGPVPLEVASLVKSIYFPTIGTMQKTTIEKFSLDNGKVSFAGQGIVPGTILNQFSMDEYKGDLRIATTVERGWNDSETVQSKNNIYVLNSDMNVVGSIEGIAPGEKIYSARFMGDRGYMVTFKYIDPLFVLDLSNPANPTILGKLKIPGYSDYMQPIDETHILGIGKDVNENFDIEKVHSPDAVYYTAIGGVKMAIFDVSDVANPKEMFKSVIGSRGTDSIALTNHKALLFDAAKELLVLPISIMEFNDTTNTSDYYSQRQTFNGAIVYNISLLSGFTERGRISHISAEDELKSGYYYDNSKQIERSLYMDNVLYTFSESMLKANALDTLANISETVFLGTDQSQVYRGYGGVPMME